MATMENGVLVTTGKDDEGIDAGYAAVRFNALKHGVLSRHVVLPHEDRAEFDDLRDALVFGMLRAEYVGQQTTRGT